MRLAALRSVWACAPPVQPASAPRAPTAQAAAPSESPIAYGPPDAALLDFLRGRGRASELSPQQTIDRTLQLLSENGRFERFLRVVGSEPPRVRAMLGALGEELEKDQKSIARLRASLNLFSRFEFGAFAALRHARKWQAKEPR